MNNDWREVRAEWRGDMVFDGHNQTGGRVQMGSADGKPGVSPMEMLLLGAAGCTGMDIVSILEKKRQKLKDLRVVVRGKRAEDCPKVYTEIEITYLLWGDDLKIKDVEDAIRLSEEKYCSASIMLRATAEIRSSYQIFQTDDVMDMAGDPA